MLIVPLSPTAARTVDVPAGDLNPADEVGTVHGAASVPAGWAKDGPDGPDGRNGVRAWVTAAGSWGAALDPRAEMHTEAEVPALADDAPDTPHVMLVSLDVLGIAAESGRGEVELEVALGGRSIGSAKVATSTPVGAPRLAGASSEERDAPWTNAIDGNPQTVWHTEWQRRKPGFPHLYTLDLGEVRTVRGFTYVPRPNRGNGTVRDYAFTLSKDGTSWSEPIAGTFDYRNGDEQTVMFPRPVTARWFRFESRNASGGVTSAAELNVIPPLKPEDAPGPPDMSVADRAWVWLDVDVAKRAIGKSLRVTVRSTGDRSVVVDNLRLWRQPEVPTRQMLGKPNGFDGPDRVDAGMLGLDCFTEHHAVPLPVMSVRDGSPAAKAGVAAGDIIVGVNGELLRPSSCAPGFDWFDNGHESTLGRAVDAALHGAGGEGETTTPSGRVILDVIRRSGKRETIDVDLPVRGGFAGQFPYGTNDLTEKMTADIVAWIAGEQKPDGRWATGGNDTIQTPLAALTLLATHDERHAPAIKKAADWCLKRFSSPEQFGNLAYWSAGYAGTFLCEYHLATGDERVLPWIRNTLRWIATGYHTSKWQVPILGHGPGGLPYDEKSLIICTAHCLVFEALARRCGVGEDESNIRATVWPYLVMTWANPESGGNGSMGYNPSYKDSAEFWARSGLIAIAESLLDDDRRPEAAKMRASIEDAMRRRHPWMRNAHAYGLPGAGWGLCGLRALSREGFDEVMHKWRWSFALAWEPGTALRYSTPHMGSPYMGEEGIINTALGMALVAARGPKGDGSQPGLHIVGATDRNWLDVSKLPHAVSDVEIQRDAKGNVSVRSIVPGPAIHVTVDGSVPTARSKEYSRPFREAGACVVHARVINRDGEEGPVAVAVFDAIARGWKAEADSEHRGLGAELAIDGDRDTFWQTRYREGVPDAHPHTLTINLKSDCPLMGLRYWPRRDGATRGTVVDYAVFVSRDGRRWERDPVATGSLEHDFGRRAPQVIRFDRVVEAEAIRLEARSALDGKWCASAAEIEPLQPQPTIAFDRGKATLTAPFGYVIRYTLDGTLPGPGSPQANGAVDVPNGAVIIARCYGNRFEGAPVAAVRGQRK